MYTIIVHSEKIKTLLTGKMYNLRYCSFCLNMRSLFKICAFDQYNVKTMTYYKQLVADRDTLDTPTITVIIKSN